MDVLPTTPLQQQKLAGFQEMNVEPPMTPHCDLPIRRGRSGLKARWRDVCPRYK